MATSQSAGTTRSVYITGDVSNPHTMEVHDASTGKPIDDLESMQLSVAVNQYTTATLTHHGGSFIAWQQWQEVVSVVSAPAKQPAKQSLTKAGGIKDGVHLLVLGLERVEPANLPEQRFRLSSRRFVVKNNELEERPQDRIELLHAFDKMTLANMNVHADVAVRQQLDQMMSRMGTTLMDEMLMSAGMTKPLSLALNTVHRLGGSYQAGGVVNAINFGGLGPAPHPGVAPSAKGGYHVHNLPAGSPPVNVTMPGAKIAPNNGPIGGMVDKAIADVIQRNKKAIHDLLGVPRTCAECGGSGEWENPITGKRSACKSCKP